MKYFLFILVFLFVPVFSNAQIENTDVQSNSSIGLVNGNGVSLGLSSGNFSNVLYADFTSDSVYNNLTVFSTSTTYTIVDLIYVQSLLETGQYLECDGKRITPNYSEGGIMVADGLYSKSVITQLSYPITCHSALHIIDPYDSGGTALIMFLYVPYDTKLVPEYPSYRDFLFLGVVGLFLISFVPIGFLYSVLRPSKS